MYTVLSVIRDFAYTTPVYVWDDHFSISGHDNNSVCEENEIKKLLSNIRPCFDSNDSPDRVICDFNQRHVLGKPLLLFQIGLDSSDSIVSQQIKQIDFRVS